MSLSSGPAGGLSKKIADHSALVGVVGLGYVGLPIALAFARRGFPVLGFDIDPSKVEKINGGRSTIRHEALEGLAELVAQGRLSATADMSRLSEPEALLICVPTPLTPEREADLTYVQQTAEQIRRGLRRGQLIVLESTTYPGTTDGYLQPELEKSGLVCGQEFFLAYSPERQDPGNREHTMGRIPKVVGGVDPTSGDLAEQLYDAVTPATVRVSSTRTAEATKLLENVFRAVNIALVNEVKLIYDRMGIDVWEVIDAASSKPFGFQRFDPGPGWGGHCVPVDPFYLSWKAREFGIDTRFIDLAGEINIQMSDFVVDKLVDALNERSRAVSGSRILILGLAYKRDVADPRESPAFPIIDRLLNKGAEVSYHDPYIPASPAMRGWPHLPTMKSVSLVAEELESCDAVVLVTDHSAVDYELVLRHAPLIVDTRGCFRDSHPKVVRA